MTRMNSRPVSQTVVYAQDTEPSDTRDGVLWVDTSEASRPVSVYSSSTGAFEPTAPGNVTVSDTAPTGKADGHVWVDTSPAGAADIRRYDAGTDSWPTATPHVEMKRTPGNNQTESVTWDSAFTSTPLVVSSCENYTSSSAAMASPVSRSTTGADLISSRAGNTFFAGAKTCIAREQ